jgi:hypothetical protein
MALCTEWYLIWKLLLGVASFKIKFHFLAIAARNVWLASLRCLKGVSLMDIFMGIGDTFYNAFLFQNLVSIGCFSFSLWQFKNNLCYYHDLDYYYCPFCIVYNLKPLHNLRNFSLSFSTISSVSQWVSRLTVSRMSMHNFDD